MDKEIKEILERCYNETKLLLTDNRELLDEIAEYLLVKETITGDELMSFVNAPKASIEEVPAEETPAEE